MYTCYKNLYEKQLYREEEWHEEIVLTTTTIIIRCIFQCSANIILSLLSWFKCIVKCIRRYVAAAMRITVESVCFRIHEMHGLARNYHNETIIIYSTEDSSKLQVMDNWWKKTLNWIGLIKSNGIKSKQWTNWYQKWITNDRKKCCIYDKFKYILTQMTFKMQMYSTCKS